MAALAPDPTAGRATLSWPEDDGWTGGATVAWKAVGSGRAAGAADSGCGAVPLSARAASLLANGGVWAAGASARAGTPEAGAEDGDEDGEKNGDADGGASPAGAACVGTRGPGVAAASRTRGAIDSPSDVVWA